MACILHLLVISLFCSFLLASSSRSSSKSKPTLLVLPVQHDGYIGLHWANIHKRTPLTQIPVLLDLNGKHLWVNCDQHYSSSTYQAPFCHSTQCARANTHTCHTCAAASRPGCHNNTCAIISSNPVTQQTAMGELAQDVLAIYDGRSSKLGPMVTVPQFLFSCAPPFLSKKGLPQNVQGVAGFGHEPISLPNQLASHFGLQRQFTMCLSRDPSSKGTILFGDELPSKKINNNNNKITINDFFSNLPFTPLTTTQQQGGEYLIHITSIRVNQHSVVPVSPSSSSNYPEGVLGKTLLSTTIPFTTFHQTVYEAFTQVFAKQLPRKAQVKAVAPFGFCFDSKYMNRVPSVELVMDRPDVVWELSGEHLMVQVQRGVSCLAFFNGGFKTRAAVTIGTRQLEENLLLFDLQRSRLGMYTSFSSHGLKCGDFYD